MAASLINTKALPAGLLAVKDQSRRARAYHAGVPYPLYRFQNWKAEELGPLPDCLPFFKTVVERGSKWLFGKPLEIKCPNNERLETFLREMWEANAMDSRLVAMAKDAGLDGGIVLKFSYDETHEERPLCIQSLSLVDECRLFYHPHDRDRLLMARVQYAYFDPAAGKTMWYREEWTDEKLIHYLPVTQESMGRADPDKFEGWIVATRQNNPFGLIPFVHIKNVETDDVWGCGDLWDLYRTGDQVNLTFFLMNRSNQMDSSINPIFIDLDLDDDDLDRPVKPGQPIDAKSSDLEGGRQGTVHFPPSGNSLRGAMMEYAKELLRQFHDAASTSVVDEDEVTNKGNLTKAVLQQLYAPQILLTNEKRKTWGKSGLARFLSLVARGVQHAGGQLSVSKDPKSWKVEIGWPEYFELTEEERVAKTGRLKEQELAGYLPHERAIEEAAQMEGRDVQAIKDELEKEPKPVMVGPDGLPVIGQPGNGQSADARQLLKQKYQERREQRLSGKAAANEPAAS